MTQSIYIIRHAQAMGQEPEAPLTTVGKQQAENLAAFLNEYPIDRLIASPFIRAVGTVEPYAKQYGKQIEVERRIGEGLIKSEQYPAWLTHLGDLFPNISLNAIESSSPTDKRDRAINAINDIIEHPSQHTAIVSHGGIIPILFHHFGYGAAFTRLTNPDVHLLTIDEQNNSTIERIWQPQ
ncbi:2,3-bisphosphoglycerate-dependent phosphoglycerate mutase [Alkalibacillus flavidus]|uniref:2,3-bisphosphoglycerate-dependent phosphoglycerate mutase n=1 Tax=Alkalibacillus flavidus TaxID=546021 RepID=A0ABV2KUA4_9BACI